VDLHLKPVEGRTPTHSLWHADHAHEIDAPVLIQGVVAIGAPQCVSHPSQSPDVLRRTSMTTISQPVEGCGMMFSVLGASRWGIRSGGEAIVMGDGGSPFLLSFKPHCLAIPTACHFVIISVDIN